MPASSIKLNSTITFTIICLFFALFSCDSDKNEYLKIKGNVFGTTFYISYSDDQQKNYTKEITELFNTFNHSLSTYHTNSTISKLNNGKLVSIVDNNFKEVFLLSKRIHNKTQGYFDPTVGKMVNAWGFGPVKNKNTPSHREVDSLMQYVGFNKVTIKGDRIIKQNPYIFLDFNAIAKGYGVDVVALFLEQKGVENYLVEIGGEVRAKGKNNKGKYWSIGIEEPNFDDSRSLKKVTRLQNESIATSGNYRKYKLDTNGNKIAHTLNPKTGFPAKTDLLSVSVIAPKGCGEVDAYATAFMAMGYTKAKELSKSIPDLKVFFIYLENNKLKTYASSNLNFVE